MAATAVVEYIGLCGLAQLQAFKQNETRIAGIGSKDFSDNWIPSSVRLKASLRLLNWTVKGKKNVPSYESIKRRRKEFSLRLAYDCYFPLKNKKEIEKTSDEKKCFPTHIQTCIIVQLHKNFQKNLLVEELEKELFWKLAEILSFSFASYLMTLLEPKGAMDFSTLHCNARKKKILQKQSNKLRKT